MCFPCTGDFRMEKTWCSPCARLLQCPHPEDLQYQIRLSCCSIVTRERELALKACQLELSRAQQLLRRYNNCILPLQIWWEFMAHVIQYWLSNFIFPAWSLTTGWHQSSLQQFSKIAAPLGMRWQLNIVIWSNASHSCSGPVWQKNSYNLFKHTDVVIHTTGTYFLQGKQYHPGSRCRERREDEENSRDLVGLHCLLYHMSPGVEKIGCGQTGWWIIIIGYHQYASVYSVVLYTTMTVSWTRCIHLWKL